MALLLGCIADDFTGAADLANTLAGRGLRVALVLGAPAGRAAPRGVDAIVVALKTRSVAPEAAVRASLRAFRWLRARGARRFLFKYCSTFDSTPRGNIGPVAAALLEAAGARFTIACPAFPANGRTVEDGVLFVNGVPLHCSGMERHPLNPMTDPFLPRVLQAQTRLRVGSLPLGVVRSGARALRAAMARLAGAGVRIAVADAVDDADLARLGAACTDLPLVTGASGIAQGLPAAWRRRGLLGVRPAAARLPRARGHAAVLAGSCSEATLRQIAAWRSAGRPALALDVEAALRDPRREVRRVLAWSAARVDREPVLIHASGERGLVRSVQRRHGRESAGRALEQVLAAVARGLVRQGVRRFVVAGGETSGAVAGALGARVLRLGPEIAPGVPWTESVGAPSLALALKSGNFGGERFFTDALAMLP